MKRLVLAYDGSPASSSALAWLARRAARERVQVDVVDVVPRITADDGGVDELDGAAAFLHDRVPGVEVAVHRLEGSVLETIAEFAAGSDLLVTGITVGHPIRAAVSGWMPLRLSTRSRVPLCLVPRGWVANDGPVTVGVAEDASSDPALAFAAAEAAATRTTLRVVHAWLLPGPAFSEAGARPVGPEAMRDRHQRVLDLAVGTVVERHPDVRLEADLVRDSRSAALLRHAARSSLLVIGTHGRGLLAGGLLGSVAQEVLWRAECPVCIVPRVDAAGTTGERSASAGGMLQLEDGGLGTTFEPELAQQ